MADSAPNLGPEPEWFNDEIAEWIDELVDEVADCTEGMHFGVNWLAWADTGGGEHWEFDEKTWIIITIHEVLKEFVGGKSDGSQGYAGCLWHVNQIRQLFDKPEEVELTFDTGIGTSKNNPTLQLSGEIDGRPTSFHLLSKPPADAEVEIYVHPGGRFSERSGPLPDEKNEGEDG